MQTKNMYINLSVGNKYIYICEFSNNWTRIPIIETAMNEIRLRVMNNNLNDSPARIGITPSFSAELYQRDSLIHFHRS